MLVGNLAQAQLNLSFVGRYSTGFYNQAAAEIMAYDAASKRMFVINGPDTSLRVVDISNPASPQEILVVSIKPYGIDLTSVAAKNGVVAVTVIDSGGKTVNGKVVFFNTNGVFINQVRVGPNPDMLTFTPDGKKILVANEGEPENYLIDPEGSVSIIDISGGISSLTQANVQTAGFTQFNNQTIDRRIKITGRIVNSSGTILRNSTIAEDLEPEYITISDDSKTAWVVCQENNCLAVLDIDQANFTQLIPLGFKNHNIPGNGLDASDQGGNINIANYPVFGLYQPDAIKNFTIGSQTYIVTANEGDARADWGNTNNEEIRFGNAAYVLDTAKFGGAANVAAIKANTALGRLNVTRFFGDNDGDGKFDSIFCYGARSFSIWNATTGALLWDSGDDFEQRLAVLFPSTFNASHANNTLKNRSDDKGPEPEAIEVATILDSIYVFVGLERMSGIFVYNVTNPNAPYFVQYISTRNFSVTPSATNLAAVGDLGIEDIKFIPKAESPIGKDLILVSNEISGTISIFEVNSRSDYQMQILHSSDMESGLDASTDAPNYAAIIDKLEEQHNNTLILSSGDNFIPSPFLFSGEDPTIQSVLRSTGSHYFAGNTTNLRAAIGRPDIAMMNIIGFNASVLGNHEFDLGTPELNSIIGMDIRPPSEANPRWIGAQFPYLSANLNFSADANLNYLFTNQRLPDTAFRTPANISNNNQKRGLAPSTIITRGGQRIGIVGATTQVLTRISSPGATTVIGPNVDDMPALAAILQPVIDSLRFAEGINKIIVLSHLQQLANEEALAELLRGVDIIIAGGSHTLCADNNDRLRAGDNAVRPYPIIKQDLDGNPTAILNTESEWKYIGRFVCDFDANGILITSGLNNNINGAYATDSIGVVTQWGNYNEAFSAGTKAHAVKQITDAVQAVITNKDGRVFGKTDVYLEGRRNVVRTEETNLGNLTADANLWFARLHDNTVKVSIKNGGGIRQSMGGVFAIGDSLVLLPTVANPAAGKQQGDISRLDIENSLRFNNNLSVLTLTAQGLRQIFEHGINATRPGTTPGQFPQVAGVQFSYDTTRASGSKIRSLVIVDSAGNRLDTIVRDGILWGNPSRNIRVVTLNFLAGGGDAYPFNTLGTNRQDLNAVFTDTLSNSQFLTGSEQDAFAEYMVARFNTIAYNQRDTSIQGDKRIQLINAREDDIFPETNRPIITLDSARRVAPPNVVRVRGVVTRAWGRFIYIQAGDAGIGVRQASGQMVTSITDGTLAQGDSVEVVGPRNDFNNYAQIQLSSGTYNQNNLVLVLSRNNTLPEPINATLSQINADGEFYESRLVRVRNLRIQAATQTFAPSTNYPVWDGIASSADTMLLRVIAAPDTEMEDVPALPIPQGWFTFEGTVIQFCSAPAQGCTTGYQLQGLRKFEIIPQLTPFTLLAPANNARVAVLQGDNTPINIRWNRSINATTYRWYIDAPNGNFNPGLASLASNNSGADTVLTLTSSAIDNLLASLGVAQGDSIEARWTVKSFLGNDSLEAVQSFNIRLVRQRNLSPFSLLTPVNNARLIASENGTQNVTITWQNAFATSYKWFLTGATGTFTAPVLVVPSNNSGAATTLTLTTGAIDQVLAGLGLAKGDSIQTKWTVYAYHNGDSLKASQEFNLKLVRQRRLTPFSLLQPANNARLVVRPSDNSLVQITWTASQGASQYRWLAITQGGNFSNPVLSLLSSDNGAARNLDLTIGSLDSILAAIGVSRGDSITIEWTVEARERTVDSRLANRSHSLSLIREPLTGVNEKSSINFVIYPNPVINSLILTFDNIEEARVIIYDLTGKLVYESTRVMSGQSLTVETLTSGTYFLHIISDDKTSITKFVKQ
jgi:2',3'-cyclic-nucleotide 2'-phosphodiesterase/3'-nucleotidase/5'-nucleotidase